MLIQPSPELQFAKLENGLRIVTTDRGGCISNLGSTGWGVERFIIIILGLFVHCGSRFEDADSFGCSQYIESMAFQATAHLGWLRTVKTIETLGVQAGCTAGR